MRELFLAGAVCSILLGGAKPSFGGGDQLLKEKSYATLKVLNILDWMGDEVRPLLPTIQAMKCGSYEERMQLKLLVKYGLADPDVLDKKKKKWL